MEYFEEQKEKSKFYLELRRSLNEVKIAKEHAYVVPENL
jgi:hypothetical protein